MKTSDPKEFSLRIGKLADAMKRDMTTVTREVSIQLLRSVVQMSPVGNPELWAANASAVYGRQTHNLFVDRVNADMAANPAAYGSKGLRRAKRLGRQALKNQYPLRAGKGYVGGRFKGNWIVSVNGRRNDTRDVVDPSGELSMKVGEGLLKYARGGDVIYIQNNVPYALPLEFGHSKQAPAGMVRLTVARFRNFIDTAVASASADKPEE